jgi:hypothetical protein
MDISIGGIYIYIYIYAKQTTDIRVNPLEYYGMGHMVYHTTKK